MEWREGEICRQENGGEGLWSTIIQLLMCLFVIQLKACTVISSYFCPPSTVSDTASSWPLTLCHLTSK